jgi:hypothetical protein
MGNPTLIIYSEENFYINIMKLIDEYIKSIDNDGSWDIDDDNIYS